MEEEDLNGSQNNLPGSSDLRSSTGVLEETFHQNNIRPRASAVLTSRESVGHISVHSPADSESESDDVTPSDDVRTGDVARTLYACQAEHESELSFQPGMLIKDIRPSDEPGWLKGTLNSRTGLFPENYIEFV